MFLDDDEDLDFEGNSTIPEDDNEEEKVEEEKAENTEEVAEEKAQANDEDEVSDEKDESEDEEAEEPKRKDNKTQALDSERARRKQAEKELKELKAQLEAEKKAKENEDIMTKEREAYKKKMLEGDLIDEETADKLLDVFGNDVIKNKLDNERRAEHEKFERQFQELKKKELFMDADVYKPQIESLMKKGLTAEQAYMASISEAKFMQMKKNLEVEIEQKILNTNEKADSIDVGIAESKGEVRRGTYTKREQEIARETGLTVEEVHKRSKMDSLEQFLNL